MSAAVCLPHTNALHLENASHWLRHTDEYLHRVPTYVRYLHVVLNVLRYMEFDVIGRN